MKHKDPKPALLLSGLLVLALCPWAMSATSSKVKLMRGQELLAARQYKQADRALTKLYEDEKTGAVAEQALLLAARAQHLAGDEVKASETLGRFLKKYPSSKWQFRAKHLLADVYCALKRYDKASQITRAHLEFVASEDTRMKLARLYLDLGDEAYEGKFVETAPGQKTRRRDINRALEFYGKALALDLPEKVSLQMCLRLSDCHARLSQYQRAASSLEPLLKSKAHTKDWPEARRRQGEALLKAGQRVEAREAFRALLELGEAHAALAMERLGDSYSPLSNDSKEAVALGLSHWRKALKQYPKAENAEGLHWKLAEALFRKGQHEDAVAEYRAFLQLCKDDDKSGVARVRIAESYERRKLFEQARRSYGSFLGRHPSHRLFAQVQERIALSWLEQGEEWASKKDTAGSAEKAVAVWQEFLKRYPVHPKAGPLTLRIGLLWLEHKDWDRALGAFEHVVRTRPRTSLGARAQFAIAEIWRRHKKDLKQAIKAYTSVVNNFRHRGPYYQAKRLLQEMYQRHLSLESERSFHTGEAPTLAVNTRNISELKFKAYQVDLQEYFRKKGRLAGFENVAVGLIKPDQSWTHKVSKYQAYQYFQETISLPLKGEGAWIVTAENEQNLVTTVVLITDIVTVVKRSSKQVFVFAQNRRSLKPAAGVTVLVSNSNKRGDIVQEGQTGQDGVFQVALDSGLQHEVFAFDKKSYAVANGDSGLQHRFGYEAKGYVYTDRPVYRPGHTVKYRAILRDVVDGQYQAKAGQDVVVQIRAVNGVTLDRQSFKTNEHGSIHGEFLIDGEAALGRCRVLVECNNHIFEGQFAIEEYKKPELLVAVQPEQAQVLTGESVKGAIVVKTYYGGVVPGAEVRAEIYRQDNPFDASIHKPLAWFFRKHKKAHGHRSLQWIQSGRGKTDDKGQWSFDFKTQALDQDSVYVVTVSVRGPDRRWVRGSGQVFCTRRSYYALLDAEKKVVRPKESLRVQLKTVNAAHQGVASRGQVRVLRLSGVAGTDNEAVLQVLPIETKASGEGSVELSLPKPGEYRLRFVGKDRRGTEVEGSVLVSASGDAEDLAKQAKIRADREVYKEGETARVLINSPEAKSLALLTFEGEKVLRYRILELSKRSNVIELKMNDRCSPNVFLNLAIATESGFYRSQDEVTVIKFLKVEIESNQQHYGPGDEVEVTVHSRDQNGRGVPAELSLAVVDQKVFAIRPDSVEAIEPFFYDQMRHNDVVTSSSRSWQFRGVIGQIDRDIIDEQVAGEMLKKLEKWRQTLSEDAKSTRDQMLMLRKEAQKAAGLKYKNADKDDAKPGSDNGAALEDEEALDNLEKPIGSDGRYMKGKEGKKGGWGGLPKLSPRKAESKSKPKAAVAKLRKRFADTAYWRHDIVTDKDGVARVRFKLPSNLTRWRLTARGATKDTLVGQGQSSLVTRKQIVASSSLPRFLTTEDTAMIRVGAHNRSGKELKGRFQWQAKGLRVSGGEAAAKWQTIKASGRRYEDLKIQGRKAGPASFINTFETPLESDAELQSLPVVAFGEPVKTGASGSLTDSAIIDLELKGPVVDGSGRLQLRLVPSHQDAILQGLRYLAEYPYGNVEQTVDRFMPLLAAKDVLTRSGQRQEGVQRRVSENLKRGVARLISVQNRDGGWGLWTGDSSQFETTAYALLGLEKARQNGVFIDSGRLKAARGAARRLLRETKERCDARAALLYALSFSQKDLTDDMNRALRTRDQLSPQGLAFLVLACIESERPYNVKTLIQELKAMSSRKQGLVLWRGSIERGWFHSDQENSAWAGVALLAVEPDSTICVDLARHFLSSQSLGHWRSTKETAAVLMFLSQWYAKQELKALDGQLTVSLAGQEVAKTKLSGLSLSERDAILDIDFSLLKPGRNRLQLTKTGAGRLAYGVALEYVRPAKAIAAAPALFEVGRRVERRVAGREVQGRPGWSVVPRAYQPKQSAQSLSEAYSGQRLWIELVLKSREDVPYVRVEDCLAAGCEVLADSARGEFSRFEARDQRAVFFLAKLKKGVTRLRYSVQAVTPGQYSVLPSQVVAIYEPELSAHSASSALTVHDDESKLAKAQQWTPDERYAEIARQFNERRYAEVLKLAKELRSLTRLKPDYDEAVLSWSLKSALALNEAPAIVQSFEALKDLNPRAVKRLTKGQWTQLVVAYDSAKEFHRAHLLGRDVLLQYFEEESQVALEYRRLNRGEQAQSYLASLLLSYPESNAMKTVWYQHAARFLDMRKVYANGLEMPMYKEAYANLKNFCTLFPDFKDSPKVRLQAARALKSLGDFEGADREAAAVLDLSADTRVREQALLLQLQTRTDRRQWQEAIKAGEQLLALRHTLKSGKKVKSPHQPRVKLSFAKIYHIQGKIELAAKYYKEVRREFPDAEAAYRFFTEKNLSVPSAVNVKPGAKAEVPVTVKNLDSLTVKVYPVDLMRLFLARKSLSNVHRIDLTGVKALHEQTVKLDKAVKFEMNDQSLTVPVKDKGVYLVVVSSGAMTRSTLVNVSNIEARLTRQGNRLQVHVKNSGKILEKARVKVAASNRLQAAGRTDARGVFQSSQVWVNGRVHVLVEHNGEYALVLE